MFNVECNAMVDMTLVQHSTLHVSRNLPTPVIISRTSELGKSSSARLSQQ